ncbi:membrane alanyl aminopeptidase-like [Leguminivora glycinivorella]|uniref:membrane alanyl aminopeptidase-like n=1 Tax=Leguminivora glycinivorella TaxID=1035111 RepID=UPI00200C864F|nr:membrane alanyl aminopeptidase-like [Leguminivora glycinivorella]
MLVAMKLLIFAVACYCANGFPQEPPKPKTTIFGDEQLQGEIFENLQLQRENFGAVAFDEEAAAAYRLPTTTKPSHYNLLWIMDFTSTPQSFSGTVNIQLEATQAGVNQIVIHSDALTIGSVTLVQGTTSIPVTSEEEPAFNFLKINLSTGTLAYNATNTVVYTLTINFSAPMREDMTGIYKSWFRNNYNDEVSWMASTHFQATAARRAFPCYDEPNLKATFEITIRRPISYGSWSLMRRASTTAVTGSPGYEDDLYHVTPVMSTYLLAMIVAEYDSLPVTNANNELIYEVIARPNALSTDQGQYALEVGQELLAEMNDHTNYNFYTMNENMKMTQAAIPDFSAGAMENWGLLVYREAYLMYDPTHTNNYYKQLIAYILSHEIAHMWFGNLVTCNWWGDFWLNEGFARYYQYFLTNWVEDYMGFETRFITEQVHTALLSDSVASAHRLSETGIGDPVQIRTMFSTLSYNKGASVIRMTEHLLGHNVHRAGLRNYLINRQFNTAVPLDLSTALEQAGVAAGALAEYGPDFSLVEYYRSFTYQAGHPILYVQVDHQTGDMTIHQRRFDLNTGYSNITSQWIIPITFSSASNPDFTNTKPSHILRKAVTVINRGSVGDEWVLFNRQQTGFYRVNYDDYTWDIITIALRGNARTQIHEYNKAQIVNDVFQYARSGIMSYTKALNILTFLEFETDYAPWVAAMTGFTWLRNRLAGTVYLEPLEALIAQWATTVMTDLTYYPTSEPEDFMRSYLRWQLAPIMCQINRDGCRAAAVAQFNELMNSNTEVYPDNRDYVYCNALREGTSEHFNFLRNRFIQHNVYTEKILIIQTLGCTSSADSLEQFLVDLFTDNYVIRRQDYTTALNAAASGNEANTQILFRFIQNNYALVANAFADIATPLSYVSSRLRSEAEIVAFQQWATQNQTLLGTSYQTVMNGAESTRQSLQWTAGIIDDVNNFLTAGYQPVTTTTQPPPTEAPAPELETRPELTQPETPDLPDSAVTKFLSVSAICMAAIFHYVL